MGEYVKKGEYLRGRQMERFEQRGREQEGVGKVGGGEGGWRGC